MRKPERGWGKTGWERGEAQKQSSLSSVISPLTRASTSYNSHSKPLHIENAAYMMPTETISLSHTLCLALLVLLFSADILAMFSMPLGGAS